MLKQKMKFQKYYFANYKVNEPSEFIELHSIDLCLKNIEFSSSDGNVLKFDRIQVVKEKDTVKIFFSEDIKTGRGKLTIEFSGQLNENLNGFYKTRCMNRNGTMGYAAVTQFEVKNRKFQL
jgi:aminopeptidase 2